MKRAHELTDDEIRILIAEDQGATWIPLAGIDGMKILSKGQHRNGLGPMRYELGNGDILAPDISNYPTDLNAMHEAWKSLTASEKDHFESALYGVVVGQAEYNRNDDAPYITNATARQRAEAYVITRNLALQ